MKLYVAKDGSSWILYSPQYKVESIRLWSEPMYGDDADQRIKRCLDKVFKNGHWYDTTHTRIRMYEDCGMKPTRFYPQWGPGNVRIEYSDFRTKGCQILEAVLFHYIPGKTCVEYIFDMMGKIGQVVVFNHDVNREDHDLLEIKVGDVQKIRTDVSFDQLPGYKDVQNRILGKLRWVDENAAFTLFKGVVDAGDDVTSLIQNLKLFNIDLTKIGLIRNSAGDYYLNQKEGFPKMTYNAVLNLGGKGIEEERVDQAK